MGVPILSISAISIDMEHMISRVSFSGSQGIIIPIDTNILKSSINMKEYRYPETLCIAIEVCPAYPECLLSYHSLPACRRVLVAPPQAALQPDGRTRSSPAPMTRRLMLGLGLGLTLASFLGEAGAETPCAANTYRTGGNCTACPANSARLAGRHTL